MQLCYVDRLRWAVSCTTSRGYCLSEAYIARTEVVCQAVSTSRSSRSASIPISGRPNVNRAQSALNIQVGRAQVVLLGSSQKICSPLRFFMRLCTRKDWPNSGCQR